jgi:hypothetical protein
MRGSQIIPRQTLRYPSSSVHMDRKLQSLLILLCLGLISTVFASHGDRDPDYQGCLYKCTMRVWSAPVQCHPMPMPLWMRLTGWTCEEDCKYHCMHWHTDKREKEGEVS